MIHYQSVDRPMCGSGLMPGDDMTRNLRDFRTVAGYVRDRVCANCLELSKALPTPPVEMPSDLIKLGVYVITELAKADISHDPKRFKKDRAAIDAALVWLGVLRVE